MNRTGLLAGVVCFLAIGCGGDGGSSKHLIVDSGVADAEGGSNDDGGGDGSALGAAGAGDDSHSVTQSIDASGGELDLDGVSVVVPAGALTSATTLVLTHLASAVPGYQLYSDVFQLLPAATTFASPVTVALPFQGDASLANVFVSRSDATGYTWQGTTATANAATASISASGQFFVANGSSYTDAPDASCTNVTVLDGVFGADRLVSLLARATDCQERGLAGQTAADFTALEDGEPLPTSSVALREPAPIGGFVTVLIDIAALQRAPTETAEATSSALSSLMDPRLRIGLSLYGASEAITELVAPTLDASTLSAGLAQLTTYKVKQTPTPAPYAAVSATVSEIATLRDAFKQRNAGGALGEGFVIWLSASNSSETKAAKSDALASIANAGDKVIEVALGDLEASDLDNDESFAAPDSSGLHRAMAAAVQRMSSLLRATYWLGYCSDETDGSHEVSARVTSTYFKLGRPGLFDATGSWPGCSAQTPLAECMALQCGGAGCGACDDTTSQCDVTSGTCQSFCATQKWCGGSAQTNPLGYSQTCDDAPSSSSCAGGCVDFTADPLNCGSCGNTCLQGGSCVAGQCTCPDGFQLCGGVCVETSINSLNCGACGVACAAGEGCFSGQCADHCPQSLHGPALVPIPTPSGGIMCIDATEVSRAQYSEFVTDKAGDASGQAAECAWNLYFTPPEYCVDHLYDVLNPDNHPQECVDWCDAAAFCSWAGKRLCGGLDQSSVATSDLADATKDEWFNACSSGGVNPYPFGSTCQTSPCVWTGFASAEIGQYDGCQASGAYAGVFDLSGNVPEWEDSCNGTTGTTDLCQTRGAGYGHIVGDCFSANQQGFGKCSYVDMPDTLVMRQLAGPGFRCCAK